MGRDILLKGLAWTIGDGKMVRIWEDRWLPSGKLLFPYFSLENAQGTTVDALIDQDAGVWNANLIRQYFNDAEANQILSIRLNPSQQVGDKWHWRFTKDGYYSVKSGYQIALGLTEYQSSSSVEAPETFWNKLWQIPSPPRVLNFLWRVAWGIIPTRLRLHQKGLDVDTSCVFCRREVESLGHVLFGCKIIQQVWMKLGLNMEGWKQHSDGREWLTQQLQTLPATTLSLTAFATDSIWLARNRQCFDKQRIDVERTTESILVRTTKYEEIRQVKADNHLRRVIAATSWHRPAQGRCKINFDASIDPKSGGVGIGVIIRDDHGTFLQALAKFIPTDWLVILGEAEAAKLGVEAAQQMELHKVELEGDSRTLIDLLINCKPNRGPESNTIFDTLIAIRNFQEVEVNWITRQCNQAADRIANWAREQNGDGAWLDDPPMWLIDILEEDS